MVVRALRQGMVVGITGLALGTAAWLLTGLVWVALPLCAFGSALPLCWLRRHDNSRLREADGLAARLVVERDEHEATRQFIQRLLDVIPMPIYVKDDASRIIVVNRAQAEEWGMSHADLIGTHSFRLGPDPDLTPLSLAEDERVLAGETIYKEEHTLKGYHGQELFRLIAKGRCEDADGKYVIVCTRFDTTRWRQAEREVQQALEREVLLRQRNQDFIQRVIDVIPDPFYIKNGEGRLLMVNAAFAQERGYPRESLIGMLAASVSFSPELAALSPEEDAAVLQGAAFDREQHFIIPHTGEERFRYVSKRRCVDIDGTPVIVSLHMNITRWKVAERKLARMAHEDELTGLPNRRRFLAEAERAISNSTRHHTPLSLVIFDLDHFKQINDQHGHVIGDQVLREVAVRLMQEMRNEDLPCRWGGEEFLVLLPMTGLTMAMTVAERLREAFASAPIHSPGLTLPLSISGGVVQKRESESLDECIARADKALYAAKHGGRNRFVTA